MKIGLIGSNHVGNAMQKSFQKKKVNYIALDAAKTIENFETCFYTDILFFSLSTFFHETSEKNEWFKIFRYLSKKKYKGIILLTAFMEPTTTEKIAKSFSNLLFIHYPVFMTHATPFHDFHHQKHIVLGSASHMSIEEREKIETFFKIYYPQARITHCHSTESECMKVFCQSFYHVKQQFFIELQELCEKINCHYKNVLDLMLKNQWIHPLHTGFMYRNDKMNHASLLLSLMKLYGTNHSLLSATIEKKSNVD